MLGLLDSSKKINLLHLFVFQKTFVTPKKRINYYLALILFIRKRSIYIQNLINVLIIYCYILRQTHTHARSFIVQLQTKEKKDIVTKYTIFRLINTIKKK